MINGINMHDKDSEIVVDMDKRMKDFLSKYDVEDLLKRYGEPHFYEGYKIETKNLTLATLLVGKKDFSIILSLQEELNEQGFNNFRSFDNSQTGWPLYTPHVICDGFTLEAKVGYYDQFVQPQDRGEIDITVCEESELDKVVGADRQLSQAIAYPDIVSNDYLEVADDFAEKAKAFLERHQVFELLKQYGEPEVYGSFELGLMNRPDIDTVLVVEKKDFSIAVELQRMLQAKGFTNFWVFDNSKGGSAEDPKHIIVDAYADEWEMGITICTKDEVEAVLAMTRQVKKAIKDDPSVRDVILKLKHEVALKHGVRHFPSRVIYQAVLEVQAQKVGEKLGLDLLKAGRVEEGPKQVVIEPKGITFTADTLGVR
jgi:hypothetical protein